MLVRRVVNQAVCWSNPQAEALEDDDVSRNASELDSASLHNRSGQAAGDAEANTDCEATSNCCNQAPRGDWRQRASIEQSVYLGSPQGGRLGRACRSDDESAKSITLDSAGWESERGIGARKPSNFGRAKSPQL